MKSKHLIFVAGIILIGCLIWIFHRRQPFQAAALLPESNVDSNVQPQAVPAPSAVQAANPGTAQSTNNEQTLTPGDREKRREAINELSLSEWKTPIEFYGMVEDESNNVVIGANVDFECNDLSKEGTSYYQTHSDMNGLFSIKNISGKLLRVTVSKNGYYAYEPNGAFFYYAGQNQNFVPDAGRPVVFYLREQGEVTNLIHYDKCFSLSRDGTPILIDLATGKVQPSSQGALQVEGWTYDGQKKEGSKYDWKCRVSVPDGGLQMYDEQFPFLAPDTGYVSEDVIDMTVTNGIQWSYPIFPK